MISVEEQQLLSIIRRANYLRYSAKNMEESLHSSTPTIMTDEICKLLEDGFVKHIIWLQETEKSNIMTAGEKSLALTYLTYVNSESKAYARHKLCASIAEGWRYDFSQRQDDTYPYTQTLSNNAEDVLTLAHFALSIRHNHRKTFRLRAHDDLENALKLALQFWHSSVIAEHRAAEKYGYNVTNPYYDGTIYECLFRAGIAPSCKTEAFEKHVTNALLQFRNNVNKGKVVDAEENIFDVAVLLEGEQ